VLRIICDSADLASATAEVPDIIITGGFALPTANEPALLLECQEIKENHTGYRDCPIKWNFRSLNRALELHGRTDLAQPLIAKADVLRQELLGALIHHDANFFISIIQAYSNRRQILGETRSDLVEYSFGNLLMRAGLFKSSINLTTAEVISDWPERQDRAPFVAEYLSAWRTGHSAGGHITYRCGPLRDIGFYPSPVFGVTDIDPRLQLADLVVGSSRQFMNYVLGGLNDQDFGVTQFRRILPHFYRTEGNRTPIGAGISVAPTRSPFSGQILRGLTTLSSN
jgi:hypothetical protein